ncbi:MAG: AAA family ATPase [Muribaculaceae bacterium]|nr:AAA family ATPase [Muribaculaceae bacterium]
MDKRIFKRKIYQKLLEWKQRSDGSSAILIEGARRIGKSTVAKEFGRNEYKSYIIIDFSDLTPELKDIFEMISDRDYFFLMLQTLTGVTLYERESLIIFDEVQLYPKARQAIKHLVADHRYDYIETGSLISIRKNVENILIPSEEERIQMFPMDFEEFLNALNKPLTYELIRNAYEKDITLPESVHRRLMTEFRLYMLVGGMPQAVEKYLEKNNFEEVDKIKREIIALYLEDFGKIDPDGMAAALFEAIPSELSRNTLRYKVGTVIENSRAERLRPLLREMKASMTVNFSYHADKPEIGLRLHASIDVFKLFISDTGLFVTLSFMDKAFTGNEIYKKLLLDKLPSDLGYVYENVVAQILMAAGHNLYYYTFKGKKDGSDKETYYEIDFLISSGSKICPIEVKSSSIKSHKSLDEFGKKFSGYIATKYLISTKPYRKEGDIVILPVYMTPFLK